VFIKEFQSKLQNEEKCTDSPPFESIARPSPVIANSMTFIHGSGESHQCFPIFFLEIFSSSSFAVAGRPGIQGKHALLHKSFPAGKVLGKSCHSIDCGWMHIKLVEFHFEGTKLRGVR
jgi:hypothetical protein